MRNFSNVHTYFLAAITKIVEPKSFREAVKDPCWREAMAIEIEALELNKTWTIVDLAPGRKLINCKWVYKVKYNFDGTIERYKARLVIWGDKQVEGLDYKETFTLAAKMASVRYFLSVAATKGWEWHQMNVNNAFLHGDLEKEVYMTLPPDSLVYVDDLVLTCMIVLFVSNSSHIFTIVFLSLIHIWRCRRRG